MIYIIRHGQTDWNVRQLLQGRSDNPLNDTGIAQARAAAGRFRGIRWARVYTSPLIRAIQTANIIAPDVVPIVDDRLIEMDYGPYEGTDLTRLPPEVLDFFRNFAHVPAPEGMEQLSQVTARVGSFLEEIKDLEGDILISTHAIAMKGLLEYLTPESKGSYWSRYVGNCGVYIAENRGGTILVPEEWKEI